MSASPQTQIAMSSTLPASCEQNAGNFPSMRSIRRRPPVARGFRPKGFAPSRRWGAARGASLFSDAIDFPIAVLHQEEMVANSAEMKAYCARNGFDLAPHGKTSMSPTLTQMQLDDGAWAISATSNWQMRTFYAMGVPRIILTNEIVNPTIIQWIAKRLNKDANFDLFLYVDSVAGVQLLENTLAQSALKRPITLLIEMGAFGGRGGVRTKETALEVARAVASSQYLMLGGVSGFEGITPVPEGKNLLEAVDSFLDLIVDTLQAIDSAGHFARTPEVLLTAGGSNFFDRVVAKFSPVTLSKPLRKVLRSGCYLTHDDGITSPGARVKDPAVDLPHFHPALEIWGEVLSIPEPTRAIVGIGRRDASFDISMPVPKLIRRTGQSAIVPASGLSTHTMNDQHLYLNIAPGTELTMGDLIAFGIAHPCTTFDKWRNMVIVDKRYNIVDIIETYF
jgi:D-serine dehydratase